MITMPNNDPNTETAVENQDTEQVASVKLDAVTGGWGWYGGPGPGPYSAQWAGPAWGGPTWGAAAWGGAPWGGGPYGSPYSAWYAANAPRRGGWY